MIDEGAGARRPQLRIVLDTNVLISGMLSPFRAPARVLELVLAGDVLLVLDDRIMAEFREVAGRDRFGFDAMAVDRLLASLDSRAEHVIGRPLAVSLDDPDDLPFLEVAAAGAVDALVTGNARHYEPRRGTHAVPVMSPAAFVESLAGP